MDITLKLNRYSNSKRIQQLGLVFPFTNSEAGTTTCKRLWTYNYMQGFETGSRSYNLGYGCLWHSLVEIILLEYKKIDDKIDVAKFYKIIEDNLDNLIKEEGNYFQEATEEEKQEVKSRIIISIEGWRINWEKNILPRFKITGVEMVVARPAMFKNADIRFPQPLIKEKDEEGVYLRPSFMGEAINKEVLEGTPENINSAPLGSILEVVLPMYKVGKIDCVLQERKTKHLWILDHKTTSRPSMYERNLKFDYQMQKYASMLQWEIEQGIHPEYKGMEVVGGIWDLCHSKMPLSVGLISGGTKLSKSKSKSIPSYVYRNAIAQNGFLEKDYEDHLLLLQQTVDAKYFILLETYYTKKDFERCYAEDFMMAHDIGNLRSALCAISDDDDDYISYCAVATRNNTICTQWGNCTFSQNCVANQPLSYYNYTRCTKVKWYTFQSN